MALIKCPECNTEMADSAPTCPKCGRPAKKKTGCLTYAVAIVLLVIGLAALFETIFL